MALISERQARIAAGMPGRLPDEPPETAGPGFFTETLPAAFRLNNTVGSLLADESPAVDRGVFGTPYVNPDFDPFVGLADAGYGRELARFSYANSAEEVEAVKAQIDRERQDRATTDAAGGWGMAADLIAGTLDPINLIPVGGQAAVTARLGGSLLKIGKSSARAGFLSSTAAEAALQASQLTRTPEESLMSIAGGTVLAGLLGPAVVVIGRGGRRAFDALSRGIERDLDVPPADRPDWSEPGFVTISRETIAQEFATRPEPPRARPAGSGGDRGARSSAAAAGDAGSGIAAFVEPIRVGATRAQPGPSVATAGTVRVPPSSRPQGTPRPGPSPGEPGGPPPSELDRGAVARAEAYIDVKRNKLTPEALAKSAGMTVDEANRSLAALVQQGRLRVVKTTTKDAKGKRQVTGSKLQRTPRHGPLDALQFMANAGGIRDAAGELAARDGQRFVPGFGNLVRDGGLDLDEIGLRLWEAGYMPHLAERPDINETLALLDEVFMGRKVFSELDRPEVETRQAEAEFANERAQELEALAEVRAEAEAMGLDVDEAQLEEAAILAHVQGLDADEALGEVLERAALASDEAPDVDPTATPQAGEVAPRQGEVDEVPGFEGPPGEGRGQPREAGGPPGGQAAGAGGRGLEGEEPGIPETDFTAEFPDMPGFFEPGPAIIATPPPEAGRSTVGAAAAGTENQLRSALGLERALSFNDPLLRMATSAAVSARRAIQELAESPLSYEQNLQGLPTARGGAVETRIKMWQAPLAEAMTDMDELFVRYRTGKAEKSFGDVARLGLRDLAGAARREHRMSYPQFKQAVGRAMRRGDRHEIPEVAEAARSYREKLFDPLKEAAVEQRFFDEDPGVATAESYMMRVYDNEILAARRPEFIRITADWLAQRRAESQAELDRRAAGLDPTTEIDDATLRRDAARDDAELEDLASQIADRIMAQPGGRLPYDVSIDGPRAVTGGGDTTGVSRPLSGRAFLIPDELIEEFLESDVEVLARIYARSMSADVELARRFGSIDLALQQDDIRREWGTLARNAKSDRERSKIKKRMDRDLSDLRAVRDRLRHVYALPENPNGLGHRALRTVMSLNYMRLLGGMTISAVPDLARTIMVHGVGRTFRAGLIPMIRNFRGSRLAGAEVERAGTALDMTLDSRAMAIADVYDDFGRFTMAERGIQAMSSRFGMVSLMAPWNQEMKRFAGIVAMSRMLEASRAAARGDLDPKELANLAAGGIDDELARRIAAEFDRHGIEDRGVMVANTEQWIDREAVEAFRAALVRDVDKVIVTPGQDRPLWISKPLGRLIGQFRSFSLASTQRIMLAGLQERDMAALNGALLSIGLGMTVYAVKNWQAGRELSDDPEVWLAEGIDRSGLTGWFFDVNNIAEKMTRGNVGVSALTGGPTISRYASRNILGAALGPSVGTISDAAQVTGSAFARDWRQSDTRSLRRLMPYQNLFYLRGLFDKAEEGVNRNLGVRQ